MNEETFDRLLEYLHQSRGFEFGAYKRASLARRVGKRMATVGIPAGDYAAYRDRLEADPTEFTGLFNTILINVTCFFRDPDVWGHLSGQVLPKLLARRGAGPIRVWSAGCASGEEVYTLAILLAEAMGARAFTERVKIYGTDVDEEALAQARQAVYTARDLEDVPERLRARYFEPRDGFQQFDGELRRAVIFGRHDLLQDTPISRLDLLACRNTLMYLNAEAQSRVLARLVSALSEGGVLVLGRAETLLGHHASFEAVDLKRRIFAKISGPGTPT